CGHRRHRRSVPLCPITAPMRARPPPAQGGPTLGRWRTIGGLLPHLRGLPMIYQNTQLLIDGQWQDAADGRTMPVYNPATDEEIGRVAHASIADLDRALAAAEKGFAAWRDTPAVERQKIMRRAAALVRERAADIATMLTQEQGKPFTEARLETLAAADIIEWFADEGMRVYGRIVPGRNLAATQMV